MENYRVRIADSILDEYLDALGYAYQRTDGVFVVPVGCLKD